MKDHSNRLVLGLDLGTSSVGWCLIEEQQPKQASPQAVTHPQRIIDMGVRIFPEGVDRSRGEKSLNEDRRLARSLRRQTYRRERRKTRLLHRLIEAGLLPENPQQRQQLWQQFDPYQLRAEALVRPLSPFELGRALYHLGQRRGYLSNRKTGDDKSDGVVAEGISTIQSAMQAGGFATLGAYLHSLNHAQQSLNDKAEPISKPTRIRQQYTSRQMFLDEFDLIWQSQKSFHCTVPHLAQRQAIWQAIFHQRPLRSQKHLVGYCEFEPQRKRAQVATLAAQEFRIVQLINTLRVNEEGDHERYLSSQERQQLLQHLQLTKILKWPKVRKALALPDHAEFNLQHTKEQGLPGNISAQLVASAIGKSAWNRLPIAQRQQLIFDLLNIDADESLEKRLLNHWQFNLDVVQKLKKNCRQLPTGYMHLSHKAMSLLNQHLIRSYADLHSNEIKLLKQTLEALPNRFHPISYHHAVCLAGYQASAHQAVQKQTRLPFPGQFARRGQHAVDNQVAITDLRNPMVERSLYQVRQVVNALIDTHGMPQLIRVEMARDLKITRRQREDDQKRLRNHERANEEIRKKLIAYGIEQPNRAQLLKYRLWQECEACCPYTGLSITMDELFGEAAQFSVEHIIPYSRSLDNSQMNKTLCANTERQYKGNQTPYERYSEDWQRFAAIKQRIKCFHPAKRKRFLKELVDPQAVINFQRNDTRYIARKAREYLSQLDCEVEPINSGQLTTILRKAWQLDDVFDAQETRTFDYRYHAIDALVIALSSAHHIQQLNHYTASHDGYRIQFLDYPEPMPSLRQQTLGALKTMVVSHKPQRKIKGPLHDETAYGLMNKREPNYKAIVVRKPLASLSSAKQLHDIRDEKIRRLALAHLEQHSNNFKNAFQNPKQPFGMITKQGLFRPIRKVRMMASRSVVPLGKNKKGKAQRHVWTRSNHHMAIFSSTDPQGKESWQAEVVSMLEAAQRHSQQQAIVNNQDQIDARFVMALHRNDLIELEHEGKRGIYRVEKMDQLGRVSFRLHHDANTKDKKRAVRLTVNALRTKFIRSIKVSVLGKPIGAH